MCSGVSIKLYCVWLTLLNEWYNQLQRRDVTVRLGYLSYKKVKLKQNTVSTSLFNFYPKCNKKEIIRLLLPVNLQKHVWFYLLLNLKIV